MGEYLALDNKGGPKAPSVYFIVGRKTLAENSDISEYRNFIQKYYPSLKCMLYERRKIKNWQRIFGTILLVGFKLLVYRRYI